jgi:hypothetical protein
MSRKVYRASSGRAQLTGSDEGCILYALVGVGKGKLVRLPEVTAKEVNGHICGDISRLLGGYRATDSQEYRVNTRVVQTRDLLDELVQFKAEWQMLSRRNDTWAES